AAEDPSRQPDGGFPRGGAPENRFHRAPLDRTVRERARGFPPDRPTLARGPSFPRVGRGRRAPARRADPREGGFPSLRALRELGGRSARRGSPGRADRAGRPSARQPSPRGGARETSATVRKPSHLQEAGGKGAPARDGPKRNGRDPDRP